MRRNAAWLALFLVLAPAAARLAASASDAAAARCALACARAGMGVEKGAVCCPMGHGPAVPTLSSCAHEGDAAPAPGAALPMLLAAALLLPLPWISDRLRVRPDPPAPFPPARLLDKVPLLLG